MIIRFTPEADTELAEARQWYAHQREDLDIEFMNAVDEALARIVSNPKQHPIVYRNLRRALFGVFRSLCFTKLQRRR